MKNSKLFVCDLYAMKTIGKICSFFVCANMIACSATHKIKIAAKKDLLQNEALTSAHLGISIYEPSKGKFWYNYQGNKYFVPASNTKLFTCYAALKYLGDSIVGIKCKETEDILFIMPVGDPTFLGISACANKHSNFYSFI